MIEALIALALLSSLALITWATFGAGARALQGIGAGVHRTEQLLELDSRVRSLASRVRTPYWLAGPVVETAGKTLSVSWLDGVRDRRLQVARSGDTLTLSDGIEKVSFGGVQDARMEVASPAPGAAAALQLTVRFRGRGSLLIIAPFGGIPFPSQPQGASTLGQRQRRPVRRGRPPDPLQRGHRRHGTPPCLGG